MRVHARQAGGARDASRQGWFVAAFFTVVFSAAYLFLSISEAIGPGPRKVTFTIVESVSAPIVDQAAELAGSGGDESPAAPPPAQQAIPGLGPSRIDPALVRVLEEAAGEDRDHVAVSVRRIPDGRAASLNGDFQFYAASTFKLAVLYEAELRHFRGELEYDDTLTLSEEDAAEDLGTSGYLEFEDDGSITIEHLLRAMITVSDNSSAVALMHAFGARNIDATLRGLGVGTMTLNQVELWTTADDLGRLMEAVHVGEGVGPGERAHMRDLLLAQTVRSGIPGALAAEVREGLKVGNKTGTWPGAQHDVAFVEAQTGAYVIAILTDGSYEGWNALQRIAAAVHEEMLQTT